MIIFWRLFLSHLLGDFTLQFDIVNRLKRKKVIGMLIHCFTHFVTATILCYSYLETVWLDWGFVKINGWVSIFLLVIFHFIVDELRINSMKKLGYRDNTIMFLLDQFLHIYVIFLLAPIDGFSNAKFLTEKWVGLISIFVIISHATTVLIYFIEKDLHQKGFPGFDEKYFLIFERIVLWALFLVKGYWWIPFMIAWIIQIFYIRRKRILDLSALNIYISIIITLIFGFWSRYLFFGKI